MLSEYYRIHGCNSVSGQLNVSGSKNACLQVLAATLLTRDACVIHNIPNLTDISFMLSIMKHLGVEIEQLDANSWKLSAVNIHGNIHDFARNFRASLCLAGPLLGRKINFHLPLPGGCNLGERPIDIHIKAFQSFGAEIHCYEHYIESDVTQVVHGANVNLTGVRGASVTGTANALMTAVLACGSSILTGCARDPEVLDLCNMLLKMGAKISGIGTDTLYVDGQKELHGVEFYVQPDRIEAGTFVILGLLLGKDLYVNNVNIDHLQSFLKVFNNTSSIELLNNSLLINKDTSFKNINITTGPHPDFPTDLQSQTAVLLSQLPGVSFVEDRVFPDRFVYADELIKMGAHIDKTRGKITITGRSELIGRYVSASDLRAGAAMVLAGCIARGETVVNSIYHILRGYEHLDKKLQNVGVDIEYISNRK